MATAMVSLFSTSARNGSFLAKLGVALLLVILTSAWSPAAVPAVAVLYGSAWSPGDTARDGAAELEVLMCAARLRSGSPLVGLISVGTRRGSFAPSAETALERVALMGIPVVRVALGETLPAHDGDVFIEAGTLSPAEAKQVLTACLSHYGALPAAADPLRPTKKERAALLTRLALYQFQFDTHNLATLAMR